MRSYGILWSRLSLLLPSSGGLLGGYSHSGTTGVINGTVIDPEARVIEGVAVTLTRIRLHAQYHRYWCGREHAGAAPALGLAGEVVGPGKGLRNEIVRLA